MSASSENRRRILSLWLPRLPIDRIKRQLSNVAPDKTFSSEVSHRSYPSVVVIKQHNALVIHALDDIAARSGLDIGLPLANARAICPELSKSLNIGAAALCQLMRAGCVRVRRLQSRAAPPHVVRIR